MKNKLLVFVLVLMFGFVVGCGSNSGSGSSSGSSGSTDNNTVEAVTDTSVTADEATTDFGVITDVVDGYTVDGTTYTFTVAGEYTLNGLLNGQIVVNAEEEVILSLAGATIISSSDAPINNIGTGDLTVSAKNGTENVVKDNRSSSVTSEYGAAIYSAEDLSIQGKGTLVVYGNYNNGIQSKNDVKVKNLSLKVQAVNNALKGNDSITVESGTVVLISTAGDGLKTDNSDISNKGNQRGSITINGGAVTIYAAGDAIQAAYNFVLTEDTASSNVTIYTGSYSGYTSSSSSATSYKGVKVANELNITAGTMNIYSYDDGLHADYGGTLENGSTGLGNINISGGTITLGVYSPTNATGKGNMGPGSSMQATVSGADGIHADNTVTISGGTVNVDSAYEGIEANFITITGGVTYVYGTDDGINASKKINKTPVITVTGGYLDVTVSSGDVDGIDSNGNYIQSGGVVVTRGATGSNGMATGLDCDGKAYISGGTFVQFGSIETSLTKQGSNTIYKLSYSSKTFSSGTWYLSSNSSLFKAVLSGSYNTCTIYSTDISSGSHTITNGSTSYSTSTSTL